MLSIAGTVSGGLAGGLLHRYLSRTDIKAAPSSRSRGRGTEISCDRSRSEDVILLERPGISRRQQEAARDSSAYAKSLILQKAEQNDMSQHDEVCRP